MHRTQPVWIGTTQTSSQACEAVLAPSFEAPGMAAPAALGQLEGFLGNLNLGKYFEVMRDNELKAKAANGFLRALAKKAKNKAGEL